jgi:hypothetical protein
MGQRSIGPVCRVRGATGMPVACAVIIGTGYRPPRGGQSPSLAGTPARCNTWSREPGLGQEPDSLDHYCTTTYRALTLGSLDPAGYCPFTREALGAQAAQKEMLQTSPTVAEYTTETRGLATVHATTAHSVRVAKRGKGQEK